MAGPLLETKLHAPALRPGLVARPRLTGRLTRGTRSVLTLVSAPAGFGKSTLLAEWLAVEDRPVAWLALDPRDNDPGVFWRYLITALQTATPGVGATALALLESPQPPVDAVLALLLNDLSALPDDRVLVLDDYHLIDARAIHEGMAFLLEHLPAQLHLVLAGRADPALPVARLRGRGELVEIRAADLRFTADEAAVYLIDTMGLAVTAHDVATLEGRTEGWIAALQLAALSLQGRDDVGAFIAGFAGDDRYIVDYLAEEVLHRQSAQVHDFLLRTSVLDRLSGPLCDAVTGQHGGQATLAGLERGNLFLIPLDDRRQWYRYHHLFADVLRARLLDEHPDDVADLHRRASGWYEQNGDPFEAIRHSLAGRDFERAADLVEAMIPALRRDRQEIQLRDWMALLPDRVVRVRPVLSVGYAGALLAVGDLDGVEARLLDAEQWLAGPAPGSESTHPTAELVVGDNAELARVPGTIELFRAAQGLARGDVPAAVGHARRALDLSTEPDHLSRAAASGLLGLAYWASGDLDAGHAAYSACMAGLYRAGHVADTFGCAIALADIRCAQGRLGDALSTYRDALQRAEEQHGPTLRGTADMYVGMSEIDRERDDLPSATAHLLRSQELGEHLGLPQNPYRRRVAAARIREVHGDFDGALELLNDAERVYVGDFFPNVRPVPAQRARVLLRQGRWVEASGWAREQGLAAGDDLSYLREFEHITLARVLVAQRNPAGDLCSLGEAIGLLDRLLAAAEAGARTGSVIEILVLLAVAQQAQGDIPAALAAIERALALSEHEAYTRIFIDEGPAALSLLRAVPKRAPAARQVRRLLAAANAVGDATPVNRGLIEPLSDREVDVLRLLGTDLDGPDIARELVVSLNTVRTHTQHIYAKLGVNNRRAAVRRATELNLMPRAGGRR